MESLAKIKNDAKDAVSKSESVDNLKDAIEELEKVRVSFLGKSGTISSLMKTLGKMDPEERKTFGAELNKLKDEVSKDIDESKKRIEKNILENRLASEKIDITEPVRKSSNGSIHPISQVIEEIINIFSSQGFEVAQGPEIEDDFHNFTALNIPEEHPARQMHDTFYFPEDENGNTALLRTHTSSVQIRTMAKSKPPFRIICPGRTYRCDSDITHSPMFHQVEGLYIDKNINMGHLKGCLTEFVEEFFGIDDIPVRFRPSFFPFTEPSAEMDIGCSRENGEFKIGAGDKWMEILGCGMVHPNVLKNVGVDPKEYQGFAFGVGIERIAMLKYGISDLRTFFDGNINWLDHYGFNALDIPSFVGRFVK